MIVYRSDWFGVAAFHRKGKACLALLRKEPIAIEIDGKAYEVRETIYIGDCSPIISPRNYAIGIKFGYLNEGLDSPFFQSNLVQGSANMELRVKRGLSNELVWRWSGECAPEPDVNGDIMASLAFSSSERDWAMVIPLDMFKNDLWCDCPVEEVRFLR